MDPLRGLREGEAKDPVPVRTEEDILALGHRKVRTPSIETYWSARKLREEGGTPSFSSILTERSGPEDISQQAATIIAYQHWGAGEHGPASRLQTESIGHYQSQSTVDVRAIISQAWAGSTGALQRLEEGVLSNSERRAIVRNRWMSHVLPEARRGQRYLHLKGTPSEGLGRLLEGEVDRFKLQRSIYGDPKGMYDRPLKGGKDVLWEDVFSRWGISKSRWEHASSVGGYQLDRFGVAAAKRGLQSKEASQLMAGSLAGRRLPTFLDYLKMPKGSRAQVARTLPHLNTPPIEDIATKKALGIPTTRQAIAGTSAMSTVRPQTALVELPEQAMFAPLREGSGEKMIHTAPPKNTPGLLHSNISLNIHNAPIDYQAIDKHLARQVRNG